MPILLVSRPRILLEIVYGEHCLAESIVGTVCLSSFGVCCWCAPRVFLLRADEDEPRIQRTFKFGNRRRASGVPRPRVYEDRQCTSRGTRLGAGRREGDRECRLFSFLVASDDDKEAQIAYRSRGCHSGSGYRHDTATRIDIIHAR